MQVEAKEVEFPTSRLSGLLEERGLFCPPAASREGDLFVETIAASNGVGADEALEWLAEKFSMVPYDLTRAACSTRAEQIFRKVARASDADAPWLPFGAVGPVLLCAHYDPSTVESWGMPHYLFERVLVGRAQYERLLGDVMERVRMTPLAATSPVEGVEGPERNTGLRTATRWMLANYPMSEGDAEKLRQSEHSFGEIDMRRVGDYRLLPPSHGPAFNYLTTGKPIFAPELTPAQEIFPDVLLEKHTVYPLYIGKRVIYLLASDRDNYTFEDEWLSSGQDAVRIINVLADAEGIREAINRNRGRAVAGGAEVAERELIYSDDANVVEIDPGEMQRINPENINTTPEQIVQWVLYRAASQGASDLHVEKYFNTARLRARIDGELNLIHSCSEDLLPRLVSLLKNYSNMGQRRQTAEDGRFGMRIGQRRIDCRVSAIPCSKELQKITIRFLDKRDGVKELSELNLSARQSGIVKNTLTRDQGLVLVTGPTGSGKTTSLYAFINSINNESINIHTIEDPIEYEIEGINQTQIDPINGIDFGEGLRRILRADPDVILIGESRDEETASAAVNAALTGHLVLTTLHANDSLRAVSRLISMGVAPYLLADSLALSQAQRLVRRLCPHCKRPAEITEEMRERFGRNGVVVAGDQSLFYLPGGCPECAETGYAGRVALMEMCEVGGEISDMIARNAPQSEMRKVANREGVLSLYQEGLIQVLGGQTTLEEIACLSYTAVATA